MPFSSFHRLCVPDFDVVEPAVLAGDAEFDLALGGVGDAGGLEPGGGLAVDRDAHFVADGLDNKRIPLAGFELGGIGDAAALEELGEFGFLGRIVAHFADLVLHAAVALVNDGDAVEADLGAAEVAVVGAFVFAVVELDVNHRGAVELDLALDDAVLGGDLQAVDGSVGLDLGFAVGGGDGLVAGLGALEGAVLDGEGRDDLVPDLGRRGALEVVGEEEFLLHGD